MPAKKRKPSRRRPNAHAKSLSGPKYRPRVVPSGKRKQRPTVEDWSRAFRGCRDAIKENP